MTHPTWTYSSIKFHIFSLILYEVLYTYSTYLDLRFAHDCSFVVSNLSKSLLIALLQSLNNMSDFWAKEPIPSPANLWSTLQNTYLDLISKDMKSACSLR